MPRLTRDQQFQKSFDDFMVSTRDMYYPDLQVWYIRCLTTNKSTRVHKYNLQIPSTRIIYTIDAHTDPISRVLHPAESVEGDQEVPEINDFMNNFHRYFDSYILKRNNIVISYTSLSNIVKNDAGDLIVSIDVCYHKSYFPYPAIITTIDQLQKQCKILEDKNKFLLDTLIDANKVCISKEKDVKHLKKRINKIIVESKIKLRETIDKMQSKIKELYKECNKSEDCPVCYECINSDKLMAPGCCHYICGDCYDRCDSCPICREEYA
jgi:hypothetical protein